MNKGPVFLSASIPYGPRAQQYHADPVAIRDAIRALVAVTLPERKLVFGGHPAISPLVWEAARSLQLEESVFIYQSELYRNRIPKEAGYFKNLVWTADINGDRDLSLARMRQRMIKDRMDEQGNELVPPYVTAFFVGGMDGVEDEWDRFCQEYPNAPAFPIISTEGAARLISSDRNRPRMPLDPQLHRELERNLNYRALLRHLLHLLP